MNIVVRKMPGATLSLYIEADLNNEHGWRLEITPDEGLPYTAARSTTVFHSPRMAGMDGLGVLDRLTRDFGVAPTDAASATEEEPKKTA